MFKNQIKKKGYDIKFEVFNFEPLVQKSRYSQKAAITQSIRSAGINHLFLLTFENKTNKYD